MDSNFLRGLLNIWFYEYDLMVMYYGRGIFELYKYWVINNLKDFKVFSVCNVLVFIFLFFYN